MMLKCFKYIFLCILIVSFVSGAVAASDDVEDPIETHGFDCEHYPTYIKFKHDFFFPCFYGHDEYPVEIYAEVRTDTEPIFGNVIGEVLDNEDPHHVDAGELFLLRDGEVIDSIDLSNEEPSFLFIFEKDHKYSLKYEGVCIINGYDIISFGDSYKELNIEILTEEDLLNNLIRYEY